MLRKLKIKLMQIKNRFNSWQFDLFSHRVCIQLGRIPEGERIAWLGNKLLNEIEGQGISINSGIVPHLDIWVYSHTDSTVIKIENMSTKFEVKGLRDLTI